MAGICLSFTKGGMYYVPMMTLISSTTVQHWNGLHIRKQRRQQTWLINFTMQRSENTTQNYVLKQQQLHSQLAHCVQFQLFQNYQQFPCPEFKCIIRVHAFVGIQLGDALQLLVCVFALSSRASTILKGPRIYLCCNSNWQANSASHSWLRSDKQLCALFTGLSEF